MIKLNKANLKNPGVVMFSILAFIVLFTVIRVLIWPLISIYLSEDEEIPSINLTEDQFQSLVAIRDSWDWKDFQDFKLRMPNYEKLELESMDENSEAFQITDPQSGEKVTIMITKTETDVESIEELLPENAEEDLLLGFTLVGEYDALRVGPLEPPYDTVTYFILQNGYIYEINAIFSTPVAFLDQILSTMIINQ